MDPRRVLKNLWNVIIIRDGIKNVNKIIFSKVELISLKGNKIEAQKQHVSWSKVHYAATRHKKKKS